MSSTPEHPPRFQLRKVLVPTDFSDASRQALPHALDFVARFNASLTLVYVLPTALPAELSQMGIVFETKRLALEARALLARFRERELPPKLKVETIVLEGGPAQEISAFARASDIDLIITATHGHTGLKHVWLGSTAERLVRIAPCPVLAVRELPVPMRFPGGEPCRFQRILVPTDFSESGGKALRYAFAQPCGSDVTLLHVVEPPPYPEFGYARLPAKEAKRKAAARKQLEEHLLELSSAGVHGSAVVRTGSAFHEIAGQAREHADDLIVVSTHGRGALAHALLGSTAERVVRHAPCPVLVVREREREFVT